MYNRDEAKRLFHLHYSPWNHHPMHPTPIEYGFVRGDVVYEFARDEDETFYGLTFVQIIDEIEEETRELRDLRFTAGKFRDEDDPEVKCRQYLEDVRRLMAIT